jgi:2-polyprenyl-6-methoxyphenol hydroxylase-like FAD-dependent oxidoreductase
MRAGYHARVVSGLDVGIVGCGFAGAAAALFLARGGHRVTLYEEAPVPRPIGAGIVLQPTGMAVLAELGLLAPVLERGARLDSLHCVTPAKRTLVELHYREIAPAAFGLGMHRGALFEVLYNAVRAAKVSVECGVAVEALERTARGKRAIVARGERLGAHDLIVVADGSRSALREPRLVRRVRPYAWGALWFLGRDPARVYERQLYQVADGTSRFVGFLPTGLGPASSPEAAPVVSLFYSVRMDRVEALRRRGLDAFKQEIEALDPRSEFLLDQIESFDQLLPASYLDVVLGAWHGDGVAYVGDAAHATSPQLGQGCNLALVDAQVLAECLHELGELPSALSEYSRRRRAHLAFYQLATRWLTPFFQSDRLWLGRLRDALMGPACALGPIRRQMIRTMAGIKCGIFFPTLPIASIAPRLAAPDISGGRA